MVGLWVLLERRPCILQSWLISFKEVSEDLVFFFFKYAISSQRTFFFLSHKDTCNQLSKYYLWQNTTFAFLYGKTCFHFWRHSVIYSGKLRDFLSSTCLAEAEMWNKFCLLFFFNAPSIQLLRLEKTLFQVRKRSLTHWLAMHSLTAVLNC